MNNDRKKDGYDFSASGKKLINDHQCKILKTLENRQKKFNESLSNAYGHISMRLTSSNWPTKIQNEYKKLLNYCDCKDQEIDDDHLHGIPIAVMRRVANELRKKISVQELEIFKKKTAFVVECFELLYKNGD